MSKYSFSELFNVDSLQRISTNIYKVAGIPIGIMGSDDVFYIRAGWQRICLDFHRTHPITFQKCLESDRYLMNHLHDMDKDYVEYKCQNGFTDIAMPIFIGEEFIATVFLGQFFYDDESVDYEFFRNQARTMGYDEEDYLRALEEVPHFSKEKVAGILDYYKGLLMNMAENGRLRSELMGALESSKFQEAKLNALFNASDDLIFVNDRHHCYREYITPHNHELYVPVEDFIGKNVKDVLPPALAEAVIRCFDKLDNGMSPDAIEYSLDVKDKVKWFSAKITKINGLEDYGYVYLTVVRDISDIKENEKLIRKMAYFDDLTGLYNRSMFHEILENTVMEHKRLGTKFAVIFMDLDNFKKVNDTRGHLIGDELLKIISDRLRFHLRKSDVISRMGGDEFTLIISELESETMLLEFAQRLLNLVNEPMIIESRPVHTSTSIGISIFPDDGQTSQELVKNADTAMYRAKEKGKNRCQLFNREINDSLQKKYRLENMLRYALKEKENLMMHYQPVIEPGSGEIRGYEALLRWYHEGAFIPPNEFIPLAEEIGLIIPLGNFVFEQVFGLAARLHADYGLRKTISVNTSTDQLKDPDFIDGIRDIIARTGVEPELIELEISENIRIEEVHKISHILSEIKKLGFRIALDDFGTGYSSLSYIKSLPLDTIKIDQLFIKDICSQDIDRNILEVIVSLARKMDLDVISEGVEEQSQVDVLCNGLTDFIQGYYYYRPMSVEELLETLS